MQIPLPIAVNYILNKLNQAGFEAFVVGGSVRDFLMGKEPHDYDVATSAVPTEMMGLFTSEKVIETGLQHGTLTVIYQSTHIEVTTYRIDGPYSDFRRPDHVHFTTKIQEDLARRDFTINAFAYHPSLGLLDYFDGQTDLKNKVIRAVGDPLTRIQEDPLRIVRALRFASIIDGTIDSQLAQVILDHKYLLDLIAVERIREEFVKLLSGKGVFRILKDFSAIIGQFIPEILPMISFHQYNPYHLYDVYEHTLYTIDAVANNPILRLTMLFHDIGKPLTFTRDENGVGHFYGHAEKSAEITREIMRRLKFDRKTMDRVIDLVLVHDRPFGKSDASQKRFIREFSWDLMEQLFEVKKADILGQAGPHQSRIDEIHIIANHMAQWVDQGTPFHRSQLAVNGSDLVPLGYQGKQIKEVLEHLIDEVLNHDLKNTREDLLGYLNRDKAKSGK